MKPSIPIKVLEDYFTGKKRRISYNEALVQYDLLRFHFDGPMRRINGMFNATTYNSNRESPYTFMDAQIERVLYYLIHERRPSETIEIWEYRTKIFECITLEATSRLLRALTKIKRSSDWGAKDYGKPSPKIAEGETLEDYCEYDFPYYTSVTNWAFAVLLKNILIDPNAVCLVMPLNPKAKANEYLKPFPIIFNTDQVYEYKENELAVLLSVEKTADNGLVFLVVTPDVIERWEQKGNSQDYLLVDSYVHGLEEMPCFRLPGEFKKAYSTDILLQSPIHGMVPRLNEAVREYSDLQAEVVMHIFSEKWEYASQKCEECYNPALGMSTGRKGTGKKTVTCQKCNGTGLMGSAPYKKTVLAVQQKIDDKNIPLPTPPMGYVQKQIDIAKLQDERVDAHIFKALASVNMEFLAKVPLSESGKAKEVDREETNNFVYSIAESVVYAIDKLYCLINDYRYKIVVPSEEKREEMLPTWPVPEKFDLMSSDYFMDDLTAGRSASLNGVSLMALENDFVVKKFYNQPKVSENLQLVFKLDPLPAANDDEKLARLQGGGVREIDYIVSCNINAFVARAVDEDDRFYDLEFSVQRAKMEEYAGEIQKDISMKAKAQQAMANPRVNPEIPPRNN